MRSNFNVSKGKKIFDLTFDAESLDLKTLNFTRGIQSNDIKLTYLRWGFS